MSKIRQTEILENVYQNINGNKILSVEDGYFNESKPTLVVGNKEVEILGSCPDGRKRKIKAILITGEGNQGVAKVKIGDDLVLPCYFSAMNRIVTSAGLRLTVEENETLSVTTTGRGSGDETFIGVTYYGC